MGYYAQVIDGMVVDVTVASEEFIRTFPGKNDGRWIETQYGTFAGVNIYGEVPLRINYAGSGYSYSDELDAFIPPNPFPSWILDETTCQWHAPIAKPDGTEFSDYVWDESIQNWVELAGPEETD